MLIDKISKSKQEIRRCNYKEENSKKISSRKKYKIDIEELKKDLKKLLTTIDVIECKLGENIKLDINSEVKTNLKELKNKLNSKNIDSFRDSYSYIINLVRKDMSELDSEYRVLWNNYYNNNYKGNISLLNMLNEFLDDTDIIKIKYNLEKYSQEWPINQKDIENIKMYSSKAYEKIAQLKLNKNIEIFLQRLLKGTVVLSDIDDEISNWINDMDLSGQIKLKI